MFFGRYDGDKTYSAITVLRLLERIDNQGLKIDLLDHNQERKFEHPKIWNFEQEFIVKIIKEKFKVDYTNEEIQRAIGILATNSTSLKLSDDYGTGFGLFPVYSMMNHSCV